MALLIFEIHIYPTRRALHQTQDVFLQIHATPASPAAPKTICNVQTNVAPYCPNCTRTSGTNMHAKYFGDDYSGILPHSC
jgi:hypothetical protein